MFTLAANLKALKFKVGDAVTIDLLPKEKHIIRKILHIEVGELTKEPIFVLDGGGNCTNCRRPYGTLISSCSAEWMYPVPEEQQDAP